MAFPPPSYQKNRLCPLCPVFFVISFILLKFFIVLNKRKNWETGQKCENPLIFLGFLLPTFVLKTGQKLGRKWAEALFQCFLPFIFQQKLGRNWAAPTFWNIKLGRKLAVSRWFFRRIPSPQGEPEPHLSSILSGCCRQPSCGASRFHQSNKNLCCS